MSFGLSAPLRAMPRSLSVRSRSGEELASAAKRFMTWSGRNPSGKHPGLLLKFPGSSHTQGNSKSRLDVTQSSPSVENSDSSCPGALTGCEEGERGPSPVFGCVFAIWVVRQFLFGPGCYWREPLLAPSKGELWRSTSWWQEHKPPRCVQRLPGILVLTSWVSPWGALWASQPFQIPEVPHLREP